LEDDKTRIKLLLSVNDDSSDEVISNKKLEEYPSKDDPAIYAKENGLLDTPGWK
jgi:hypothetical protein